MNKKFFFILLGFVAFVLASCTDSAMETTTTRIVIIPDDTTQHGPLPQWYHTGGKLGTTYMISSFCFSQPTPAVDQNGTMTDRFERGDQLAERTFNTNESGVRTGLGPVYVRSSCQHCHPNYSHGTSVPAGRYSTTGMGNGTLLVVYDPTTQQYVQWLAGMPQLHAVAPFKAPLDENQITVTWLDATDNWGNTFPDGEKYSLRYPEVNMPTSAIYGWDKIQTMAQAKNHSTNYTVGLENTIGIYGTGLLDAIPDDSIVAQWAKEESDGYMQNGLNNAYFANGQWTGWYSSSIVSPGDGQKYVRRFTYALSRGPLLDAAGANAIWNITNVTRSNRTVHYLSLTPDYYATLAAQDEDVQKDFAAYIAAIDPDSTHSEWFTGNKEEEIYNYLTSKNLPAEMNDEEFTEMMVWHRGLAVPAARNVYDTTVLRGKELFTQIGCAYCHRPSWTTGDDHVNDPNNFYEGSADMMMPRYPNQTIWPYTDMVQHKLHMANDIRTGWCRTTPLWGRGLHQLATGDMYEARMHDTRARNVIEAIMWHGYSTQSDAYRTVENFRQLPKADREAIVKFINSI